MRTKIDRLIATTVVLTGLLLATSTLNPGTSAQGGIPDSPTGRMAQALARLTHSAGDQAMQAFLQERVAESTRDGRSGEEFLDLLMQLRSEFPMAAIETAMKTGPTTARITLRSPAGGRVGVISFEVDPDPPHHLKKLSLEPDGAEEVGHPEAHAPAHAAHKPARGIPTSGSREEMPPPVAKRLRGFIDAFNSGDPETMSAFAGENMTKEFQERRTEEEDRALYENLVHMIGSLENPEIAMTGDGEATLSATTAGHGDLAELIFDLQAEPPHLIRGYSVSVEQAPPPDTLPAFEIPPGTSRQAFRSALDAYLADLTKRDLFSGSLLVSRKGEILFEGAYGLANREAGVPNHPKTMFDLGSITKAFTKIAAGQLIRDGKIAIDDTILDHIPDYPNREAGKKITIAHLLNHSSGLGDIFDGRFLELRKSLIAPRDFFTLFADRPLLFEPGERRQYSNAGYILLGAIIEAASGQPYDEYIMEKIFDPAGMDRSGFFERNGTVRDVAVGYTRGGPGNDSGDLRPNSEILPIKGCPAGSSSSSAGDLLKFDRALRSGRLLGPEWTGWYFTGETPGAGSATDRPDHGPGGYQIAIAGGGPGVNTALESGDDLVVIVLVNLDPPVAQELARKIQRATRALAG
ncbi:MAG: serine hydrolase [Acidobacteria bacterium]|nr:serine hydrolase [Acidobacteriota bacterium]